MEKNEFIISYNKNLLLKRIMCALNTDAINTFHMLKKRIRGTIMCVGTGGSFASAVFASKCINELEEDAFAIALKPRDASLQLSKKIDLVILFSYSGTSNDILSIYYSCKQIGIDAIVITSLNPLQESCHYQKEEMISYFCDESDFEEKGFISMASTLIPMCIFAFEYYGDKGAFEELLKECFERWEKYFSQNDILKHIKHPYIIDIFSGYDVFTASAILESDIVESGIGRAIVHEKKDFSHGRYNAIESMKPDIVIFMNNTIGAYTSKLRKYLLDRINCSFLEMKTKYNNIWGDFDLAIGVQFFVSKLSENSDYDMSDPIYPSEAKLLYKYSDIDIL